MFFLSVLCLLCLCARLFIYALWSPAGKGLASWLSFVASNCKFVTFPLVSWVRWCTWFYRYLIFAPLLTLYFDQTLCHSFQWYRPFSIPCHVSLQFLKNIPQSRNFYENSMILYNYWLLRHWTWCDIDLRVPILTEAVSLYNFSKQKKQQQQQNLGYWLCLGQSWFFYTMSNWFHSVKRGINAYFICKYNCRQRRSGLNAA